MKLCPRHEKFRCNILENSGKCFSDLSNVRCYVDDPVIHSEYEESHIEHLENLFSVATQAWASYSLKKCSFMQPLVEFLESRINKEGIHTDERKVQTIHDV